jgi:hypothetical protein
VPLFDGIGTSARIRLDVDRRPVCSPDGKLLSMPERKLPWTPLDADVARVEFQIVFETGDFDSEIRVDVKKSPRTVRISVLSAWNPPAGRWLTNIERQERTVQLAQPLGSRRLIGRSVKGRPGPAPHVDELGHAR